MLAFLRANAWMIAVIAALVAGLFWMLDPAPPRVLTLATGVEEDRVMLSAVVTLVAGDRFHRGLTPLVLEAATDLMRPGGRLEAPGEFPAAWPSEFALVPEAEHYLRNGPPFLMRYLPFWAATMVFRSIILVVPLLAVLIPLIRIAPPIYVWRTRKKIYRWYKDIREIDQRLQSGRNNEKIREDLARLRKLEDEVLQIKVPLSHADELYDLHLHIEWVIRRLERQQSEAKAAGTGGGA